MQQKNKYRIVIKTQVDGEKLFYIQKRSFFGLWIYHKETRGVDCPAYIVPYSSLQDAEKEIQDFTLNDHRKRRQRILSKEIYYP